MGTAACKAATYEDHLDGSIRPFELIEGRFDLEQCVQFAELGLQSWA